MKRKNSSQTLFEIHNMLYSAYGTQGWWPILSMAGKAGFDAQGYHPNDYSWPKNDAQQWEVVVGAILTQNTSWKNVEKAMKQLHAENLIAKENIITCDVKKLAHCIKHAGYFNQKAHRLKLVAQFFKEHPRILHVLDDKVNGVSELRAALLAVKGIGPETADSIVLYAAKKPSFVIDAYTKRIMFRIGIVRKDASYDELQQLFMKALPRDAALFNEYHALLVGHAKQYCRNKPLCGECPLASRCRKLIEK